MGEAQSQPSASRILTVPNFVSVLRLGCVPLFCVLLLGMGNRAGSAILLGVLGATDWVDGYIARRFNQGSELGKILDPTADRLMFLAAVVAMMVDGSLHAAFGVTMLVREAAVSLGRGGAGRTGGTSDRRHLDRQDGHIRAYVRPTAPAARRFQCWRGNRHTRRRLGPGHPLAGAQLLRRGGIHPSSPPGPRRWETRRHRSLKLRLRVVSIPGTVSLMNVPGELRYSEDHEWTRADGNRVILGITDYAQDALGDVVYIDLPPVGSEVALGEPFSEVESTKSVSEINAPVSGVVVEVNTDLIDHPRAAERGPLRRGLDLRDRSLRPLGAGQSLGRGGLHRAYRDRRLTSRPFDDEAHEAFCPQCGYPSGSGVNFCASCGHRLNPAGDPRRGHVRG